MQKRYNWGILGAGDIARKFARDLQLLPQANLYAVGSGSAERAQRFAEEFSMSKAYGTYGDFAADPDIDIVYVASRHVGHYPDTMLCLNHGKAVLCEKPVAMNARQFKKMRELALAKNLFFMEALWTRFIPSFLKAKELVSREVIGKISMIESDFCFQPPYDEKGRLFNPDLGGGALLDVGIYPLFAALEFGGDIKDIKAMTQFGDTGVDIFTGMLVEHTTGIVSVLYCSVNTPGKVETVIHGSEGMLRMNKWWHTPTSLDIIRPDGATEHFAFEKHGFGYQYEADEVMHCLDNGRIQSDLFSWEHSDRLITALDRVRKLTGITYPAEVEKT